MAARDAQSESGVSSTGPCRLPPAPQASGEHGLGFTFLSRGMSDVAARPGKATAPRRG